MKIYENTILDLVSWEYLTYGLEKLLKIELFGINGREKAWKF